MSRYSLYEAVSLADSSARIANGSGSAVRLLQGLEKIATALAFVLDVTVDEQTSADKLDVYIQTKLDAVNWVDVQRFTQHDGNLAAKRYFAKITAQAALTEFENAAALSEASKRDLLGLEFRARWVITDDSGNASFTFSVTAIPI